MLNENSTKKEIELRFQNARRIMDDLTRAYYGMPWDELIRCLGNFGKEARTHDSNSIDKADN